MEFEHYPVMLSECINFLAIKPNGIYIDGTVGGGSHSYNIAKQLNTGHLYCFDRDPDALNASSKRMNEFNNVTFIHSNYVEMNALNVTADGILLDLGVSSYQLDTLERGFSYHGEATLDMRMSKSGMSAKELVNKYSVNDLIRIFRQYGEEPFAKQIAFNIEKKRSVSEIITTLELADIIRASVPMAKRREKNPCKRVFQAIRIEINGELDALRDGLDIAFSKLNSGGRLAVITFHSLEDRMVKHKFLELSKGCICPPDCPICICNNKPKGKLITRKPIIPTELELEQNKRSASAKLRVIEKI